MSSVTVPYHVQKQLCAEKEAHKKMQKEKQQAAEKEKEENREKRLWELVPARRCRHCRVAFTSDRKLEAHEEKCTPNP